MTAVGAAGTVPARHVTTRQAAFIGVGAMVGAGIFSLLGTAGEVAGSAVWVAFALAGIIAALQGYSFARLGARYPSAGGLLEYVNQGFGEGHVATVTAWLVFAANVIVTAMVALSFGSYASDSVAGGSVAGVKAFAVLLVVAMTGLNIAGSTFVARVSSLVVFIVVGILAVFAVVTIANADPALLAPSTYPPVRDIVSAVALTFFAFLGFGVVTFTARDLADPARQLPRAMAIAIGIAAAIYIAVSLGVFGTLTVPEVVAAGPTAIAVAAQPVLGQAGYWLMTVTALFATAGATNAGLYPATGLSDHLAATGQFPDLMARRIGGVAPAGLVIAAAGIILLVVLFDLSSVASIGSAVALGIFALVTIGHLRIRRDTGANLALLLLGLVTTSITLLTFLFTTLINEPGSIVALVAIVLLSLGIDAWWGRVRAGRAAEFPGDRLSRPVDRVEADHGSRARLAAVPAVGLDWRTRPCGAGAARSRIGTLRAVRRRDARSSRQRGGSGSGTTGVRAALDSGTCTPGAFEHPHGDDGDRRSAGRAEPGSRSGSGCRSCRFTSDTHARFRARSSKRGHPRKMAGQSPEPVPSPIAGQAAASSVRDRTPTFA